ncbi:uncharacterized protein Dsimw501_GD29588 [Drosophila simulans]|uniref:Uncharacterized protein n=1 Tax=Drosophila simulans TaxID=7240 RepID=A0A0J9RRP8_DROSI|nr:uncharacterized protein Dsimw501_GD29588 [Drosophila simulans]
MTNVATAGNAATLLGFRSSIVGALMIVVDNVWPVVMEWNGMDNLTDERPTQRCDVR